MFKFFFALAPVEEILPWGDGINSKLHWFGLTDGHYWISTPLGDALRYQNAFQTKWKVSSPYVDYQVARLFEDLQNILPAVLEPVPSDIATFVANSGWFDSVERWIELAADEDMQHERSRLYRDAINWYSERTLDSMHLEDGPNFHFLRIGNDIRVRWEVKEKEENEKWTLPYGEFSLGTEQFASAAYSFLDELIEAMQSRIDSIVKHGWTRNDCTLDLAVLIAEQKQRKLRIKKLKHLTVNTDWNNVRALLQQLTRKLINSNIQCLPINE